MRGLFDAVVDFVWGVAILTVGVAGGLVLGSYVLNYLEVLP